MRINVPYIEQKDNFMCGPAVLQMVLAFFGVHAEQEALAHLVTTSPKFGTPASRMARAAREYGFGYTVKQGASVEDIKIYLGDDLPVIVNFIEPDGNEGHFGLVIGHEEDELIIHDPWNGPEFKIKEEEFVRRWRAENDGRYHWILIIDNRVKIPQKDSR